MTLESIEVDALAESILKRIQNTPRRASASATSGPYTHFGLYHYPSESYENAVRRLEGVVVASTGASKESKILDLAAGSGFSTRHIAEMTGSRSVVGLVTDASQESQARSVSSTVPVEYVVAKEMNTTGRLPFPDEHFDAVVGFEAMLGVADKENLLREIHRVLKPAGRFAATEWVLSPGEENASKVQALVETYEMMPLVTMSFFRQAFEAANMDMQMSVNLACEGDVSRNFAYMDDPDVQESQSPRVQQTLQWDRLVRAALSEGAITIARFMAVKAGGAPAHGSFSSSVVAPVKPVGVITPGSVYNTGIVAMDAWVPHVYVSQEKLEQFDGVSSGKYTIGLGQTNMGFCDDREDIHSICLTVVKSLMEKYNISYKAIGRLEIGTETIIDKSKSAKTVVMQLFAENGNTNVEGVDTTNACYGGTAALFNSVAWVQSDAWDGRYALVVAADIATYAKGNARPTGGAGAVAMLIGRNAPLIIEKGFAHTHMEHAYDFYKPNLSSEYPTVDGKLSVSCYLRALDTCYRGLSKKVERFEGKPLSMDGFDYCAFHTPYNKLIRKSFGRILYNDFLANPDDPQFEAVQQFRGVSDSDSYGNRDIETTFMKLSQKQYEEKLRPADHAGRQVGNMYCGSLYAALLCLICTKKNVLSVNDRILMFAYGSGLASSMFTIRVNGTVQPIADKAKLRELLEARMELSPEDFDKAMQLRELAHGRADHIPAGRLDTLRPGTFYLQQVDSAYRRTYAVKE